ncbi:MAG: radical SAM protein [Methanobacteriota archaeon]|nr:MAG: radical SAM protein [Euryarchaeota archaeon]
MKIYSIFLSIQGEGITIGAPTVFIRTSGCPLRCTYCDTPQAFDKGEEMPLEDIISRVEEYGVGTVCLTGGEPLAQKDSYRLIDRLLGKRHLVVVETSGAITLEEMPCDANLSISMDMKCPSSGESSRMMFENIELLGPTDQLKFVISDKRDYEFAKKVVTEHRPSCAVVFTPVGGKDLKDLAEKVLKDGIEVRVLPQLHKFIWGDSDNR